MSFDILSHFSVKTPNSFSIGSSGNSLNKNRSIVESEPSVTMRNNTQQRAHSMDDLSRPKLYHKTSVRISRKIT